MTIYLNYQCLTIIAELRTDFSFQYILVQACSDEKRSEKVTLDSGDAWCQLMQWIMPEKHKSCPACFSCQQWSEIVQVNLLAL